MGEPGQNAVTDGLESLLGQDPTEDRRAYAWSLELGAVTWQEPGDGRSWAKPLYAIPCRLNNGFYAPQMVGWEGALGIST